MRILLANYRYFVTGGPERYMFAVQRLLEQGGHTVQPFSVRSGRNVPTPHEAHFLSPIGRTDAHLFADYDRSPATTAKVLARCFYSPEGFRKARQVAASARADVAYCLQFLNKMSPSILDGFKSAGIPVVIRASDYSLACPQGHLMSGDRICTRCVGRSPWPSVRERCINGSLSAGLVKASAWTLHRLMGSIRRVDAVVCPSTFLRDILIRAGFPDHKLYHVRTPIDTTDLSPDGPADAGFVFAGRATHIKGLDLLLEAHAKLGPKAPGLTVTGCADEDQCRELSRRHGPGITFLPFLERTELFKIVGRALAVVSPSLWFDNQPNAVLEAMALGRPVIAPDHGSFPEIVRHQRTGLMFAPLDADALADRLSWAAKHPGEMRRMGMTARAMVEERHSPRAHYDALMALFSRVAGRR